MTELQTADIDALKVRNATSAETERVQRGSTDPQNQLTILVTSFEQANNWKIIEGELFNRTLSTTVLSNS